MALIAKDNLMNFPLLHSLVFVLLLEIDQKYLSLKILLVPMPLGPHLLVLFVFVSYLSAQSTVRLLVP